MVVETGASTNNPSPEFLYKTTDYYSPEHERSIIWNDKDLGINWRVKEGAEMISLKDAKLPNFKDSDYYFD